MEGHQQDIPLNYASQQLSLDASKPRYPLADSAGNAQGPPLDNIYNDRKGALNYTTHFSLPILQSQQAQRPPNQTPLEFRKSQTRSHRFHRSRNPIAESENYQNYRSRQTRDNVKDIKWPDDLEDLFLDALLVMPKMGRRKFCFNGKLHGRNELISLYLWIGHCESLLPNQKPDETKRRDRKQVSSHIQVLKGFMRGHPSFRILFLKKDSKNEIQDSFKDDPCLRALTQNRLPYRCRNRIEHVTTINDQPSSPSLRSQSYFFSMTGEKGESTGRYLFPGSSPQSYSLGPSHNDAYPAILPESFSAWVEASSLPGGPLQNSTVTSLNSIPEEVEFTPQPVGEVESPFPKYNYYRPDLTPENTSFMSREARENDITLVDNQGNNHIDSFMQGGDMSLGGFDSIPNFWNAPPLDNFDPNVEFQLSSFSNATASNSNVHTWDGMVKNQPWGTVNAGSESV